LGDPVKAITRSITPPGTSVSPAQVPQATLPPPDPLFTQQQVLSQQENIQALQSVAAGDQASLLARYGFMRATAGGFVPTAGNTALPNQPAPARQL
jgi:hypothetical protein